MIETIQKMAWKIFASEKSLPFWTVTRQQSIHSTQAAKTLCIIGCLQLFVLRQTRSSQKKLPPVDVCECQANLSRFIQQPLHERSEDSAANVAKSLMVSSKKRENSTPTFLGGMRDIHCNRVLRWPLALRTTPEPFKHAVSITLQRIKKDYLSARAIFVLYIVAPFIGCGRQRENEPPNSLRTFHRVFIKAHTTVKTTIWIK